MKFRNPTFAVIRNTIIFFILITIAAMLISLFISGKQLIDFFIIKGIFIGCAVICMVEFIALYCWWLTIVFDKIRKNVLITRYIFLFKFKQYKIPFGNVELSLNHEYMAGCRGAGGHVWVLRIREKEGRLDLIEKELRALSLSNLGFEIRHGLRKAFLEKKQKEIEDFIKKWS